MALDLMIAVLAALSGFIAMLCLLLLWVGDGMTEPVVPYADDAIVGSRDQGAADEPRDELIPMPEGLRTRDEIVAWLTQDLPRLTAALPKSGG